MSDEPTTPTMPTPAPDTTAAPASAAQGGDVTAKHFLKSATGVKKKPLPLGRGFLKVI